MAKQPSNPQPDLLKRNPENVGDRLLLILKKLPSGSNSGDMEDVWKKVLGVECTINLFRSLMEVE